jgi:AcrR family transcriptional regulator
VSAVQPRKVASSQATKSDETRQRILDAAAKVFAQRGYAHTRLTDIAAAASTHPGGIYYYFESREALVQEILRISTEGSVEKIKAALAELPPDASSFQRLLTAATAQIGQVLSDNQYNAAFNKIYSQLPAELRLRHGQILRKYFEIWRVIIRTGQANGEIRDDLDAAVIRHAVVGSIQWVNEWARPSVLSHEELGRQMATIFFSGMAKPK